MLSKDFPEAGATGLIFSIVVVLVHEEIEVLLKVLENSFKKKVDRVEVEHKE
jgi:hypothetical protein